VTLKMTQFGPKSCPNSSKSPNLVTLVEGQALRVGNPLIAIRTGLGIKRKGKKYGIDPKTSNGKRRQSHLNKIWIDLRSIIHQSWNEVVTE